MRIKPEARLVFLAVLIALTLFLIMLPFTVKGQETVSPQYATVLYNLPSDAIIVIGSTETMSTFNQLYSELNAADEDSGMPLFGIFRDMTAATGWEWSTEPTVVIYTIHGEPVTFLVYEAQR